MPDDVYEFPSDVTHFQEMRIEGRMRAEHLSAADFTFAVHGVPWNSDRDRPRCFRVLAASRWDVPLVFHYHYQYTFDINKSRLIHPDGVGGFIAVPLCDLLRERAIFGF